MKDSKKQATYSGFHKVKPVVVKHLLASQIAALSDKPSLIQIQ